MEGGDDHLEVLHLRDSVSKQEAFCWIFFGSSMASTIKHFADSCMFSSLLLSLFTYWSLYAAAAEYSTRFSADGSDHRLFYMMLAMSIFFMDINFTGDILVQDADTRRLYFNALATCYCLLGMMHARVGYWLPACRGFATFHLALNAASASLYIWAGRSPEGRCQVISWLACALFFPRTYGRSLHDPGSTTRQRNAKDYIGRSQTVMITTLALLGKFITNGVRPGEAEVGHVRFWDVVASFLLVMLIKILLYDVHVADTQWHAIRCTQTPLRPTAFLALIPVAMAGVMMMAAGAFLVVDQEFKDYRDAAAAANRRAGRDLSQGFGILLLVATIQRLLHKEPPAPPGKAQLKAIWKVQVGVQLLFAGMSMYFSGKISGRAGLYSCVVLSSILVAINFLDEFEELREYRGNWKVVRSLSKLHSTSSLLKSLSGNSLNDHATDRAA
ncbi:unnamed protein product [Symbiodinium microadriaticum]|nr:unnamed protein product [Symbiodinium microadriaticum]CAE7714316.1 unnamed protein product [Symbiodinium sp. KB8]